MNQKMINRLEIEISIIIVIWYTCAILNNALSSIYKFENSIKQTSEKIQQKNFSFEIIVIDYTSKNNSAEMVKFAFPRVILIKNNINLGLAKANNQGIRISRGKYILLLNSDVINLNNVIYRIQLYSRFFYWGIISLINNKNMRK